MKPIRVKRYLRLNGELKRLLCVSSELEGSLVTTYYVLDELKPKQRKHSKHSAQAARMLARLKQYHDEDVSAIKLHRAASGSAAGFSATLSRRISDLRDMGYNVVCSKRKMVSGKLHTWYKLITKPDLPCYD